MEAATGLGVATVLVAALALLWVMQRLGRGGASRLLSSRHKTRAEARSHFMAAAQLLARSRGIADQDAKGAKRLARDALRECDKAISVDSRDAASYIVKALALEQLGHKSAALRCLSTALSPPASRSLSTLERADALLRRATMSLAASSPRNRRASKSAIQDLEECLMLNPQLEARACPIMATCYDALGMSDEASRWRHKATAAAAH